MEEAYYGTGIENRHCGHRTLARCVLWPAGEAIDEAQQNAVDEYCFIGQLETEHNRSKAGNSRRKTDNDSAAGGAE
jgi:hypothetical protein